MLQMSCRVPLQPPLIRDKGQNVTTDPSIFTAAKTLSFSATAFPAEEMTVGRKKRRINFRRRPCAKLVFYSKKSTRHGVLVSIHERRLGDNNRQKLKMSFGDRRS